MRDETRYRVTGSLFLLALAVICLPMLLDGAGLPARSLPDLPMEETLPEVRPVSGQVPESDYVARVQELRDQVDEEGFLTGSGTRFGEPVLRPVDAPDAEPDAGSGALSDPSRSLESGGEDMHAEGNRIPAPAVQRDAWAVQVASFAGAGNAEEFRTRLRRDGYEAFISTARVDDQVLRRVAVGPLLDRRRAETLRGELSARYEVEARLMAFTN